MNHFFWESGFGRRAFRGHGHGGPRHFQGHGFGERKRSGRGDLKYAILAVLLDGPRHGYDIMLEMEQRRGLRPSPGSIYPALQFLEDGDFVTGAERDGKRVYTITDAGRKLLEERDPADSDEDEAAAGIFGSFANGARALRDLRDLVKQTLRTGDPELVKQVADILVKARRDIYALLAERT
ncbi:MAG: PadR family transcriptional regulator [Candidatus Velthaea sp.]|jgi:DNA-binding PadR family transcriptional regulator